MLKNSINNLRDRELLLFSDEEMNPRLNADREEVLNTFSPLCDAIVRAVLQAGDEYLQIARDHPIARRESTFPSSVLHGFIIENLSKIPGVKLTTINKRNTFIEVDSYKVWVKKLDERGMPWVNETKSSVKRAYQQAEGEDIMPILILGFQLNQAEMISRIELRYIDGDRQIWAPIDLGNMAAASVSANEVVLHTDEPEVTIKPEKKRKQIAS